MDNIQRKQNPYLKSHTWNVQFVEEKDRRYKMYLTAELHK